VERWVTVLAENNPDTITALYSKDAVLRGNDLLPCFWADLCWKIPV